MIRQSPANAGHRFAGKGCFPIAAAANPIAVGSPRTYRRRGTDSQGGSPCPAPTPASASQTCSTCRRATTSSSTPSDRRPENRVAGDRRDIAAEVSALPAPADPRATQPRSVGETPDSWVRSGVTRKQVMIGPIHQASATSDKPIPPGRLRGACFDAYEGSPGPRFGRRSAARRRRRRLMRIANIDAAPIRVSGLYDRMMVGPRSPNKGGPKISPFFSAARRTVAGGEGVDRRRTDLARHRSAPLIACPSIEIRQRCHVVVAGVSPARGQGF
jgi:hypothetical protein